MIAGTVKGVRPARTRMRLVEAPKPTLFDSITRQCCIKRIRLLGRAYQLTWLVDQATFDIPNIDCLSDEGLAALMTQLETARECIAEGVPFEDAGLITNISRRLPEFQS